MVGRQLWVWGGVLLSLGLGLSSSAPLPSSSRPLPSRNDDDLVASPAREWLTSRPQVPGERLHESDLKRLQQMLLHQEDGNAMSTRPRHTAPAQQPRATAEGLQHTARKLKAEQTNAVWQLQQENKHMCKQVERLNQTVLVLQAQLRESEEKRKQQHEYQAVLENIRSELEANHIIELVAEKEKCKVERTNVQSERGALQRVEQELRREREQVLRLRAQVEELQTQAAAAAVQACAEQAQLKQVKENLQADADKAKEDLERERAAVRESRKELQAVRDEAMRDRQHLTMLQNRMQGKAAQFEDQAGALQHAMQRQQDLLGRLKQEISAPECRPAASAVGASSGSSPAQNVQGCSREEKHKEASTDTKEQVGVKLAHRLCALRGSLSAPVLSPPEAVAVVAATAVGGGVEARNATAPDAAREQATLENLLGDVRGLLQQLMNPSALPSSAGSRPSTVNIARSNSYPYQWRPFPGQQCLSPAKAVIERQGSGVLQLAGGGADCADRAKPRYSSLRGGVSINDGMPRQPALLQPVFGDKGSGDTAVSSKRTWCHSLLSTLVGTSRLLANMVFVTVGTPQRPVQSLTRAIVFFFVILALVSASPAARLRLPHYQLTFGNMWWPFIPQYPSFSVVVT